jgi:hypothetical protein
MTCFVGLKDLRLEYFKAIATAACHMFIADARKARGVLADVRWRWKLKILRGAATTRCHRRLATIDGVFHVSGN